MKSTILYFFIGIFFIPTAEAHYKEVRVATPASPQSEEAIEAISNFQATPLSSSSIELSWNRSIIDSQDYIIERTTNGSEITLLEANVGWLQTSIRYVDEGLEANQSYAYRIKEENATEFAAETAATTEDEAPVAPSSFVATALSSSAITLTWVDNADNEEGYKVERLSSDGETYTEIAQLPANTTTYEDGSLQYNTVFTYRISAHNAIGSSEYVTASATTMNVAPVAPSDLATSFTSNSITLMWTDNADNETAYIVERSSTGAEESYEEIATLEPNTTAFINFELKHNTTYYYRLKAQNEIGASAYITTSATTLNIVPAPPTALAAADISISSIRLEWKDEADNENAYTVEWSSTGTEGSFTAITTTLPPNTNTYTHTSLVSNTTYYYRVKATNEVGSSAYSEIVTATTEKNPPSLPPTELTVKESTTNTITLTWINNATNATGFIIERTQTPVDLNSFQEVASLGITPLTYIDEDLKPNTTYFYRIKAFNKDGESGYSSIASGNTKLELGPPATPTEFKATAVSTFQINLSWKDNANNETSYIIERATEETGEFSRLSPLPANTEFFENIGLKANTTYYYRVIAKNNDGEAASGTISAKTYEAAQPPTAPSNLSAVAVSTVQINLSWTDNSNSETNFKIERSTSSTGPFEFIAAVGANVTTYQNFGLSPNTTYYYRVQAISGDGASAFTNTANAMTYSAPQPPSAPSKLAATGVSTSQINLTWQDNSNNETGFVIERASSSDGPFSFVGAVGANVTSFENTGLNANTRYYYKVRAINNDGTSGFSNTASSTTLQVPVAPTAPTNLAATGVSTTQINLTWQDNATSETNFEVYRSNAEGGPFTLLASVPANQTTYESTGLSPSTTYYYRVLASNKDGKSGYSNVASATTSGVALPPNAPDGLTALAVSTTQINLKWNDRSDNETNFVIERSIGNNTHYEIIADVNANDTTFESTGLTANQTYFYRVRAANEDGNSAYSNEASATTLSTGVAPNAPSDLYGRVLSQTSIELFWTDNSNNEEVFILERAEERNGERGSFVPIDNAITSNTISYLNSGLAPDTKYWYRIKAKNQDGESSYTESAAIITSVDGKPVIVMHEETKFPHFYIDGTEQLKISIKVVEPKNIISMTLMHKPIRENAWKEKEAASTGDNEYQVFIKQTEDLDEIGIEYHFLAEDESGNKYVSPIARTYLKFEASGPTLSNLKFGSDIAAYQMISIPLVLESATVASVFEDDLGPADPTQWRLYRLDENDAVVEMRSSDNIEPGKGYWLIVKDQSEIRLGAGNVLQVTQEEPFVWSLKKGWNFIGNPYPFDINWGDVLDENGNPEVVAESIHIYNRKYEKALTLRAFQGAYVLADEIVDIKVPLVSKIASNNSGKMGIMGIMAANHKRLTSEHTHPDLGWKVNFTLKSDELLYTLSGLGMHPEANLNKDKYDEVALPRLSKYVDIEFEHPEYFIPVFTQDIVPIQEEFIWDMKVVGSSAQSPIVISWEKPVNIPMGKHLVLFDPVQQHILDMMTNDQYIVRGVQSPLQVYYGDAQFIDANLKPLSNQVGEAYPNPFTDNLFFPIVLLESDQPYHVQIQLFNSLGVEVGNKTIVINGGFHEVKLIDGVDGRLSRGTYFYKVLIKQGDRLTIKKSGRLIKR